MCTKLGCFVKNNNDVQSRTFLIKCEGNKLDKSKFFLSIANELASPCNKIFYCFLTKQASLVLMFIPQKEKYLLLIPRTKEPSFTFLSVLFFLQLLLFPFFHEWTLHISFLTPSNIVAWSKPSPLSIPKTKYVVGTQLYPGFHLHRPEETSMIPRPIVYGAWRQ